MEQKQLYLASKPRYGVLDGLRGVAALMVVIFHCFETYSWQTGTQIVNHGYLAVDFFFMLSGFVIGYAYDDRWNKMSISGFFKRRLVRLHPMVIAGMLVGACLYFFGDSDICPLISEVEPWKFFLCLAMGLLMIPCGPSLDIRGWNELNSFNGPQWTLTFEYLANILYAFVLRRLPTVILGILCAGSIVLTLDVTLGWDIFGFFPDGAKYSVIGGWNLQPEQMYIGITRLSYPFLFGLLASRIMFKRSSENNPSGSPISLRGGFWWTSLLLVAIFSLPAVGGGNTLNDGLYQAGCILLLFPFAVIIGAGSKTTDAKSTAWCEFLGKISYPLYITHYPIMYMQMAWVTAHTGTPVWIHIMVNIAVITLSLFIAWALLRLYDEPVRQWLTRKWLQRQ